MEGSTTLHCLDANQSMLESRQDTVEMEQAEVEEPQDPGTYPTTAKLAGGEI